MDNNTQKNTKGGSPGIIDHLNEVDTVKLDMGGRRVYVQEVVKHRLITGKHEVVCVVECTGGGYLFMTKQQNGGSVQCNSYTTVLCSYLQFVHRCNHVDTIVYNVGDGGVDLTVQSQETKVTQVNLSGCL